MDGPKPHIGAPPLLRPIWRAMLRRRPLFPRASAALSAEMGAGLRPAEVGRHGGRPSSFITNAARERPSKPLVGDAKSRTGSFTFPVDRDVWSCKNP